MMIETDKAISGPKRLLIVDDDPLIHEGVKFCLSDEFEITCVTSGELAIDMARHHSFPVVVLDLLMVGMSGSETMKALKTMWPLQQIIIFTGHASVDDAIAAVNHDVYRFLTKPFRLNEFRDSLRCAYSHFEKILQIEARTIVSPEQLREIGLSARESEIIFRLLQNERPKQIAEFLKISVRTIEKHIERTLKRLGISNRAELALCIQNRRHAFLLARQSAVGGYSLLSLAFFIF